MRGCGRLYIYHGVSHIAADSACRQMMHIEPVMLATGQADATDEEGTRAAARP